jgi:hypothetical protein
MKPMKHSPERAAGGWVVAWGVGIAFAAAFVAPACTTSTTVTTVGCSLNSDCSSGLTCALGKCRTQCVTAADCGTGGSCIDDGRDPVCEPPLEKNTPCARQSDCATPLACASDYRCRNLCESDADCNVLGIRGRVCAADRNGVHYCADPAEVSDGMLDTKPPPGASSAPVVEPEGGVSALLAALPSGDLIATNVGQAGGVVGIAGVTVTIPANALSSTLAITIQRSGLLGPNGTMGQVFDIGPTGTTFAVPISVAFDYTDGELAGLAPSDFAVETSADSGASWTPLSQIVVDVYAHTIAGQTTHLSPYALVQQGLGGQVSGEGGVVTVGDSGSSMIGDGGGDAIASDGGTRAQPGLDAGEPNGPGLDAALGADAGFPGVQFDGGPIGIFTEAGL